MSATSSGEALINGVTPESEVMTSGQTGGSAPAPSNHVELFVRAGKDGETYGACPLCQQMFMILLLKAGHGDLTFTVTTVNMAKPPADFKRLTSRLPALVHQGEVISDPDEMVEYVEANWPRPPLQLDSVSAAVACRDVFSRFTHFVRGVDASPAALDAALSRVDVALRESGTRFLSRDTPTELDCRMLPKLQHLRVVAARWRNYRIPARLDALWRYLAAAYSSDVFRRTCPADQEIIHHWTAKLPPLPADSTAATARAPAGDASPSYSFSVPDNVPSL